MADLCMCGHEEREHGRPPTFSRPVPDCADAPHGDCWHDDCQCLAYRRSPLSAFRGPAVTFTREEATVSKENDALDARIIAALRHEALRFAALCEVLGIDPTSRDAVPEWRAVDRALQRLRKRGVIACACTLWSVREVSP